jgi:hypothetical protein
MDKSKIFATNDQIWEVEKEEGYDIRELAK